MSSTYFDSSDNIILSNEANILTDTNTISVFIHKDANLFDNIYSLPTTINDYAGTSYQNTYVICLSGNNVYGGEKYFNFIDVSNNNLQYLNYVITARGNNSNNFTYKLIEGENVIDLTTYSEGVSLPAPYDSAQKITTLSYYYQRNT